MDLTVKIKDQTFKNPVWVASGTFGYGEEFKDFIDLEKVGAIITKTITLNAREGNPPPRIVETSSGMLNSIGLENKGIEHFVEKYYPFLEKLDTKTIVSIAGRDKDEFEKCIEALEAISPDAIEINLSCPNVVHRQTKHKLIAQDPETTEEIIAAVRKKTESVLIAKLTPNVTDISEIALAAEAGGADALSVVNTYLGMAVDAEEMKPILGNVVGGLSGPAIKPMALKAVYDVAKKVKVPVIGIGGIMTGRDVAEFMLCGAAAVQVGTANLADPSAHNKILSEFEEYLDEKGIKKASDIVGKLKD